MLITDINLQLNAPVDHDWEWLHRRHPTFSTGHSSSWSRSLNYKQDNTADVSPHCVHKDASVCTCCRKNGDMDGGLRHFRRIHDRMGIRGSMSRFYGAYYWARGDVLLRRKALRSKWIRLHFRSLQRSIFVSIWIYSTEGLWKRNKAFDVFCVFY